MLGNPPWDKVRFEDQQFWVCRFPGYKVLATGKERDAKTTELLATDPNLRGSYMSARERASTEQAIFGGRNSPYTLRGSIGHLDYAKLFGERLLQITNSSGRLGIVLPRQFLVLGGWGALRKAYFDSHHTKIWELVNNGKWVFDDVHASYRVVLLSVSRSQTNSIVDFVCDVRSPSEINSLEPLTLTKKLRDEISDSDQIPSVSAQGAKLFSTLCGMSRLGQKAESHLHAYAVSYLDWTQGEPLSHVTVKRTDYPVVQTRHIVAFGLNNDEPFKKWVIPKNANELVSSQGLRSEAGEYVKNEVWADGAGMNSVRVCFRYPSRSDDSRTLIAAILPCGILPAKGYAHWLLFGHTRWDDRLLLIGLLNSAILDWFARRVVDRHVTDRLLRILPVPTYTKTRSLENFIIQCASALSKKTMARGELPTIDAEIQQLEPREIRIRLDAAAFFYYGVSAKDAAMVFEDFSEDAFDESYRSAVRKLLSDVLPKKFKA
jgi:hypothetical protein